MCAGEKGDNSEILPQSSIRQTFNDRILRPIAFIIFFIFLIFAKDISDKGLLAQIYRELLKLNNESRNNLINKCSKDTNRYFTKEDIQMTNKHIKRCSMLCIIWELQVKTMRCHYRSLRVLNTQKH